MTRVVAYVPDLMDRSKVAAAAPATTFVARPEDLAAAAVNADVVVVDLGRSGVVEVLPTLATLGTLRLVGFASHVDHDTRAAAAAAGCHEVLPRSTFFRGLTQLLGGPAPPSPLP